MAPGDNGQKRTEEGQKQPDKGRTSRILEYFNKS